ncbi:MAG: right-handed parallel beta-helix repeat-containing protein [Ignavibacteriae bacterium]|nr:right-handed parallel beta-helix repeat-containing protein [Ignavibacteriota bacterium]
MRRAVLRLGVCLCLLPWAAAAADTWYVDARAGNDTFDGRTPASAFRSIARVNQLALKGGDTVYFHRGDVFFGEIAAKAGSPSRPVVYGAYGNGDAPVLCGATSLPVTGWTSAGRGIFVHDNVSMTAMNDGEPANLFFNGRVLTPARHPNEGYLVAQAVTGGNPGSHCCEYSLVFTDSALRMPFPRATDLVGTHVTAYDPYGVSTREIRSYDPATGRAAMDTLRGAAFIGNRLYFLSAGLAYLDADDEWYYDAAARRLWVRFAGGRPPAAGDTLLASSTSFGINAWQTPHIVVRDISFRNQKIAGIWCIRSDDVTIERCHFTGMKHGVQVWGSGGPPEVRVRLVRVIGCRFEHTLRTGIDARNLEEGTLRGNTFSDIGIRNALGQNSKPDQWRGYGYYDYGIGIQASGINTVIEENRMLRCGRQGITAGGPGVHVRGNVIDEPCLSYNDCGGLMPLGASVHEENIVRSSYGPFPQFAANGARGIYPDFRSGDTIRNNTVIGVVVGIGLTNAKQEHVTRNTVYGARVAAFTMNRKTPGPLQNTVTSNTFFSVDPLACSLRWENFLMEPDASDIDSNRYWNPYTEFPVVRQKPDSSSGELLWDLRGWRGTGHDRNTTAGFATLPHEYRVFDTLGVSLVANSTFETGLQGWFFSDSASIVEGVLDGRCVRLKKNSTGGKTFWTMLTQRLDTANTYLVRFSVSDPSNIGRVAIRFREDAAVWNVLHERLFLTTRARREYAYVFRPKAQVRARLECVSSNSQYWLDNIVVTRVNAALLPVDSLFPILVNESGAARRIDVPRGVYVDLDSNLVRGSVVLAPYSSVILVARDGPAALAPPPAPRVPRITLWPNPTRGAVEILADVPGVHTAVLYDALGRRAADITALLEIDGRGTFDTSTLPAPGMYILEVCDTHGGRHFTRFQRL